MQRLQLVVILDWIAATPANCLGPAPRTPPDQLQRPAWHKWSLKDWLLNQANMFSGEDPLPQNWVRVLSRGTGQMYYANVETGVAQSEKPQSVTLCHQGLLGRQQSHPRYKVAYMLALKITRRSGSAWAALRLWLCRFSVLLILPTLGFRKRSPV